MASRPIWRGHLRLALVTCPVALYTARHERNAIRFNLSPDEVGEQEQAIDDAEASLREWRTMIAEADTSAQIPQPPPSLPPTS